MSTADGTTGAANAHSIGDRHLLAINALGVMTLAGPLVLTLLYRNELNIDPGGSSRSVTLPAVATSNGARFLIRNTADAYGEWLTVQDATPTTKVILGRGESALLVCDGAVWYVADLNEKPLQYASVAASAAITGATETDTVFDKNLSIPANKLAAGDVIEVEAQGIHTATTGSEDHTIALKVGSVTIVSVAAVDPANNDLFYFKARIQIRTIGATGTLVAAGVVMAAAATAAGDAAPFLKASDTIDTTAANVVGVYIDRQASATDSDSARLDVINIKILRA